jgi:EAL domain-containing protein (putative c-di-GMP-specific phosphodiesterase class I)
MGKSLQPLNAMAVRPPINTPAAAANAASEPMTAESLGWQLRAALPPLRLHSVSLFDEQANVLWLSEGALGPDEHNVVLEAMETLAHDRSLACHENGLEDGRVGIFLPVRAPQGDLVGVAMILADLKSVGDGVLEKIVSPQVRTIMQKVAVLLRASSARPGEPAAPISVAIVPVIEFTPERAPERAPTPARAAAAPAPQAPAIPPTLSAPAPAPKATTAPAKPAANTKLNGSHGAATPATAAPAAARPAAAPVAPPVAPAADQQSLSPQAIDDILEFELFPDLGTHDEELVPKSPASSFQQAEALAWEPPTSSYQVLNQTPPPVVHYEPAKPAAPESAARAAAPVKSTAPVKPAAPAKTAAPAPAVPVTPAQAAPPASFALPNIDLSIPEALQSNGAASSFAPAASASSAIVVPNVPTLQAPTAAPVLASVATAPAAFESGPVLPAINPLANPTPVPAAKSTGATTTSKALGSTVTTTGTSRSLNGSTSIVQSLNGSGASATSRNVALDPSSLILDVQPFTKLRPGGRLRRYEVLPRIPHRDANRAPAAMDGLALQRLLSWLGSNRSAWNLEPTSFSLNLSISTLEDERFPQQVASSLKANGIAPDNLGFEIAEPLCTQRRAQVERFISLCDKLGCFVVIDDFSFDSSVLPLLRSKALRLVKIDPKLTSAALRDKLSQAMVVAIVQAVKVLGIHCAAKRVESQASLQWLTAIGCDLAQGPALSQVLPIESLNMPQAPAAETGKAAG